jgi:hypothetical protein
VEQAFKELKHDLAIRPIYHQTDARIEAHILVAFLAYCLQVTLKQRLRSRAPGLTSRSVLDKMSPIQMVDVHLPTTDARTVTLSRYTEPEPDQALLLQILKLNLPGQPPQGSCRMELRYRNDRGLCGADLAGPSHRKPPAWRNQIGTSCEDGLAPSKGSASRGRNCTPGCSPWFSGH